MEHSGWPRFFSCYLITLVRGGQASLERSPESCVRSWSPGTLDGVAGILRSALRSLPKSRPRLLRWRLSSLFQVLHCVGLAAESLPPAPPARPVPFCAPPAPPMESCEWRDRLVAVDRRRLGACKPGRAQSDLEVWGQRIAGPGETAPTRSSASMSPRTRHATAQPIGSETWRGASPPWLYAALFCPAIDALELEFVTSSFKRTNRKGSREEAVLPSRLCFFRRVSGRARAEGAGELASRVARMSSEAPPLRLYIKRWRGARRRHFALEWSSL